jgi:hypothetical protein
MYFQNTLHKKGPYLAMRKPGNEVQPTECLHLNLTLLKLGSIFPLDEVSSVTCINFLYKGYTAFTVILFYSVSIAAPLFIICEDYPLQDGIEVMSIILTQIRSGMKLMTFILYRKEVRSLIRNLYENFYIHGRDLTAEESCVIREATGHTRRMTSACIILYFITGLSMVLHPLTSARAEPDDEGSSNCTSAPHRSLPFKSYYPNWDHTKSPEYEIEYIAQATLTILEAWSLGCIDTFCVALMIYVGCQFDLLGISLKNVKKNVLMRCGPQIYEKGIKGYYRKQIPTVESAEFPVISDEAGNSPRKSVNDRNYLHPTDGIILLHISKQFGWREGHRTSSTVDSYAHVESETETYIKECIKHHQSLLM